MGAVRAHWAIRAHGAVRSHWGIRAHGTVRGSWGCKGACKAMVGMGRRGAWGGVGPYEATVAINGAAWTHTRAGTLGGSVSALGAPPNGIVLHQCAWLRSPRQSERINRPCFHRGARQDRARRAALTDFVAKAASAGIRAVLADSRQSFEIIDAQSERDQESAFA